ncbi:hypothetical protein AgCh_040376 [Apium graveolens]
MVRTSTNPENHSFIAHNNSQHTLCLINKNFLDIANDFKLPLKLNKPRAYDGLNIVGSCNGLICLSYKRQRQRLKRRLYLWNPATRQLKDINDYTHIINKYNYYYHGVSIGFGFDLSSSDYKKEIKVDLKFRVHKYESYDLHPATVKGSPYWIIEQNPVDQQLAMISFNMQSEKFSTISLPDGMCHRYSSIVNIIEFKESVAVAVAARSLDEDINIWTLDDDNGWIKKFTIPNPKFRISACLKNGDFVGDIFYRLVVYDSVNEVVTPTQLLVVRPTIYNYSESLVNLN